MPEGNPNQATQSNCTIQVEDFDLEGRFVVKYAKRGRPRRGDPALRQFLQTLADTMAPGGKKTPKKGKSPPKTKPQPKQVNKPEDEPGFRLFDDGSNFVHTGGGTLPQDPAQNVPGDDEEDFEDAQNDEENPEDSGDENDSEDDETDLQVPTDWQSALMMMQQQFNQQINELASKLLPAQKKKPETRARLPDVSVPPPKTKRPKPPVQTFDHVGLKFYTGATDDDGTNPVALMIDREVTARQAIHRSDPDSKPQDYKYALGGYDHLEPIETYCLLTSPREFDTWKDHWKDHVSKIARGVHPSLIKEKCLMAMKASLSTTTSHWIENRHTLDDKRDDPDAILKALQDHAHENANVPNMLLKQTQATLMLDK